MPLEQRLIQHSVHGLAVPLLENNELGKERLIRNCALLTVHITTKSWQLLKEKGLCAAVQTCQSTGASSLSVCLPSTPSSHVSVWPDLYICSETLLPSRGFLLFSTSAKSGFFPASPLLPPLLSPRRLQLYGSFGLPPPPACPCLLEWKKLSW